MNSRVFATVSLAVLFFTFPVLAEDPPGPPITMACFDDRVCNSDQTQGDTWASTWLADGRTLVQYNDGNGFSEPHQNVHHDGICELHGSPDDIAHLTGTDLNPGKLGNFIGQTYSTDTYEIGHALYHFICRSIQIPGQWAFYDTCIYKSSDGGANWINQRGEKNTYMPEKLETSTFPDKRWDEVNFVKYGRGGEAPDIDRAREFAYLNCGAHLARVRRADLDAWTTTFDPAKIQYYCGVNNADGEIDSNWTPQIARATTTKKDVGLDVGAVIWNPGLRRYLRTAAGGDSWENPPITSTFYLSEAPHPWGPWTQINSENMDPRTGDNQSFFLLMQNFMSADGTRMWATMSGRKPYGLQFLPVYLTTSPVITRAAESDDFSKPDASSTFSIPITKAGLYTLRYHYQCDRAGQTISLAVNDQAPRHLNLGDTFASQNPWTCGSARIHLDAGTDVIRFSLAPGNTPNPHLLLDRIDVGLLDSNAAAR